MKQACFFLPARGKSKNCKELFLNCGGASLGSHPRRNYIAKLGELARGLVRLLKKFSGAGWDPLVK